MKKVLLIILAVVVVIGLGGTIAFSRIQAGLNQLVELEIAAIDFDSIPDGTYTGSYKVFPVSAEVVVTVAERTLTEIALLKHNNGQGAPAEVVVDRVVDAQSLQVDTISGATFSSKVILKAIEDALIQE